MDGSNPDRLSGGIQSMDAVSVAKCSNLVCATDTIRRSQSFPHAAMRHFVEDFEESTLTH